VKNDPRLGLVAVDPTAPRKLLDASLLTPIQRRALAWARNEFRLEGLEEMAEVEQVLTPVTS
jgi:hypothetical protein